MDSPSMIQPYRDIVRDMGPVNEVNATGPMALEDAKHAWLIDAEHAIAALVARNIRNPLRTFTADDVRSHIGNPEHPNWWGIAFAQAKRRGEIESVSSETARARSRNGGSLKVWRAAHR